MPTKPASPSSSSTTTERSVRRSPWPSTRKTTWKWSWSPWTAKAPPRRREVRQPDVVLVDLQMPGIDGLETSRRIRAVSKETAVVVLTGSDDELALGRAIQAGAHGFLRKTAAVQDLAEAVRAAHRGEPLNAHDEVEFALRRLRRLRARDDDIDQRFDRLTPPRAPDPAAARGRARPRTRSPRSSRSAATRCGRTSRTS